MRERDPRTGKQLPSSPYAFFRDLRKKPRGVQAARAPFPWGTEAGEGAVTAQGPGRNPGAPPTLSGEPSEAPRAPWFCRGSGKVCVRPCVPACPSWRHTLCGARPTFEQVQEGKEGQIRWDGGASATQDPLGTKCPPRPVTVPITPPSAFLILVLPAGGPGSGGIRLVQD